MTTTDAWGPGSKPSTASTVETVNVDGELVLWDPVLQRVHRLDPIGSLLWPFLDGSTSLDELSADVADAWERPVGEVLPSIVELVHELDRFGLLEGTEEPIGEPPAAPARPRYLIDPPSP